MLLSGTLTKEPGIDENNGGPYSEQSFSSQEGSLFNIFVSYREALRSTLPHCIAFIVNMATWGPRYSTNVGKPDPANKQCLTSQILIA